jgi:hypothetical protein
MRKCLNELTNDDLAEVKKLSAVFFTPKEIADILEVERTAFVDACNDDTTDVYEAFTGGLLLSEYEIRTSVLKLAKAGSSPAQAMALDLLKKVRVKMMD